MVLLLKQWKSRSSPGFAGGVKANPFAMLKKPLPALPSGGFFVRVAGDAGWSSPVARQAHNLKVAGSNPAPATNLKALEVNSRAFLLGFLHIFPFYPRLWNRLEPDAFPCTKPHTSTHTFPTHRPHIGKNSGRCLDLGT